MAENTETHDSTLPTPTTKVTFFVRRATVADMDRLRFIWCETQDMLAKGDRRYQLAPQAADIWCENVQLWLTNPEMAIFVAEKEHQAGHVIGYAIGAIATQPPTVQPSRYGLVSDLAIDSHGKAGGIGKALIEALQTWFKEQGLTHLEARVPHRHAIAQAFWRALGASELYEQMWLKLD